MSDTTGIEWADSTFNPWMGCTKISPACDHCYAERDTARFGRVEWGAGMRRVRTSAANWRKPLQWNQTPFNECVACGWRGEAPRIKRLHAGERGTLTHSITCPACSRMSIQARRRVFCASLADVFDNEVDTQWRADLFDLILRTPKLDWLLLTKRIGNVRGMLPATVNGFADVYPNVWVGATICNQAEADRDIAKLLSTPAAKRFLSMEPLLGPVDLRRAWHGETALGGTCPGRHVPAMKGVARASIDWVIVGGESGPQARPTHPDWVRSLRNQCAEAGVPFLFKQWGEWAPHTLHPGGDEGGDLRRGHVRYLPGDGREADGTFRKGDAAVARLGKKAAGRMLDGKSHTEYPHP